MDSSQKSIDTLKISPGELIAGRFEISELIGTGGMGQVFRVLDRELNNETVALKLLHPYLAQDETVFRRFRNEVLVARSLSHPNIVRTHDIGHAEQGFTYISMEYVDGVTLKERLVIHLGDERKPNPFQLADAVAILLQILSGVSYAHGKGVIHRDLKPANVIISKKAEVKLADFGTARIIGMDTSITRTGQVIGTPDYMSPEQIRGEFLDPSCDIYSLGIIAYELVTGSVPFIADSAVAVAYKHLHDPIPHFASSKSVIPSWYREMVCRAAAKKREDRFFSAAEFARFLVEHMPVQSNHSEFLSVENTHFFSSQGEQDNGNRRLTSSPITDGATSQQTGFRLGTTNLTKPEASLTDAWTLDYKDAQRNLTSTQKPSVSGAKHYPTATKARPQTSFWGQFLFLIVFLFLALFFLIRWNQGLNSLARSSLQAWARHSGKKPLIISRLLGFSLEDSSYLPPIDQPLSSTHSPRTKEDKQTNPQGAASPAPKTAATPLEKAPRDEPKQEKKVPENTDTAKNITAVEPALTAGESSSKTLNSPSMEDIKTSEPVVTTQPQQTPQATPSPAELPLSGSLHLRIGEKLLENEVISIDSLHNGRWIAVLNNLSFPKDSSEQNAYLRELALSVYDIRMAKMLGKLSPKGLDPQGGSSPSFRTEGNLGDLAALNPHAGDYRLDLLYQGNVLASKIISVYAARTGLTPIDKQVPVVAGASVVRSSALMGAGTAPLDSPLSNPTAVPATVMDNSAADSRSPQIPSLSPELKDKIPEPRLPQEAPIAEPPNIGAGTPSYGVQPNVAFMGLPPAKTLPGQAPISRPLATPPPATLPGSDILITSRPSPEKEMYQAPSGELKQFNALPGEERYQGTLSVSAEEELSAARRTINMVITFNGGQISGQATVGGLPTFSVSGRVYPRGIELTLSNGTDTLNLSGARYTRSLRGRYTSNREMRGVWEVSRTN